MRGAVDGVLPVGAAEALHHLLDSDGPVHGQRRIVRGARPAQHRHLAETVDVIGVEVREEQRFDSTGREAEALEVARPAGARVHHDERPAGDHRDAGARTHRIGQRTAGTAQQDVQPIGQRRDRIGAHVARERAIHHAQRDRRAQRPERCGGEHDHEQREPSSGHPGASLRRRHCGTRHAIMRRATRSRRESDPPHRTASRT